MTIIRARSWRVGPDPSSGYPEDGSADITASAGAGSTEAAPDDSLATVGPTDQRGVRSVEVVVDGWRFVLLVEPADTAELRARASFGRAREDAPDGQVDVRAIIPGRVVSVSVVDGDVVGAGQRLLVVEAMKMQNDVLAPRAGVVSAVAASVGSTVEVGDVLLSLTT